jgi:hypothetical protein
MNIGESDAQPARYAKLGNADERKDQLWGNASLNKRERFIGFHPMMDRSTMALLTSARTCDSGGNGTI